MMLAPFRTEALKKELMLVTCFNRETHVYDDKLVRFGVPLVLTCSSHNTWLELHMLVF